MPLFVYPEKVRNFHMYKAFQINVPVNSSCTHLPPPPGLLRAICSPCSPRGGAFANFALPGYRAFADPGAIYSRAFDTHEVSYQNTTTERILLKKKKEGHRALTACSRFYACVSSLLIKIELHRETRELSTWTNVFWIANQISVDIIWRTSFHVYKTIHIIIFIYVGI